MGQLRGIWRCVGGYGGGGGFMSSSQGFTSPGFGQSPSTDRRVCGGGERKEGVGVCMCAAHHAYTVRRLFTCCACMKQSLQKMQGNNNNTTERQSNTTQLA